MYHPGVLRLPRAFGSLLDDEPILDRRQPTQEPGNDQGWWLGNERVMVRLPFCRESSPYGAFALTSAVGKNCPASIVTHLAIVDYSSVANSRTRLRFQAKLKARLQSAHLLPEMHGQSSDEEHGHDKGGSNVVILRLCAAPVINHRHHHIPEASRKHNKYRR